MVIAILSIGGGAAAEVPETGTAAFSDFLLNEALEIAYAKSAAPAAISDAATIMVLRANGYETAIEGTNGMVCYVVRSFGGPTYIPPAVTPQYKVPECLDPIGVEKLLPLQLYRAELYAQGYSFAEIEQKAKEAFRSGRFQRVKSASISYMLSNAMMYNTGPGSPHIMIYLPDSYTNEMAGGLSSAEGVLFVEGGPEAPYVAAVIRRPGTDLNLAE
jgi:hypothetical protein